MQILSNPISALSVRESPKFSRPGRPAIGAEEHDGDVIFFTGSGITAISRMCNTSGHNYWNSSFIVDVAWGRYHVPQNTFLVNNDDMSCDNIFAFFSVVVD